MVTLHIKVEGAATSSSINIDHNNVPLSRGKGKVQLDIQKWYWLGYHFEGKPQTEMSITLSCESDDVAGLSSNPIVVRIGSTMKSKGGTKKFFLD